MDDFIKRSDALKVIETANRMVSKLLEATMQLCVTMDRIAAADVVPVVRCADCKHNNACLTQAFVEDESRVPFDRNTFFCADGKRDDARWWRDG